MTPGDAATFLITGASPGFVSLYLGWRDSHPSRSTGL